MTLPSASPDNCHSIQPSSLFQLHPLLDTRQLSTHRLLSLPPPFHPGALLNSIPSLSVQGRGLPTPSGCQDNAKHICRQFHWSVCLSECGEWDDIICLFSIRCGKSFKQQVFGSDVRCCCGSVPHTPPSSPSLLLLLLRPQRH